MSMMDSQQFCLKWDGFQSSVTSVFDHLRRDGELVDITLCCEGHQVRAHRMMLSACSPYFRELLKNNPCQQMVFFLKDTSAIDLSAIIEFMYKGSVNVAQTQLASFIKTAEMLQIRGLSGEDDKPAPASSPSSPSAVRRRPPSRPISPPSKRSRRSAGGEREPPPPPPAAGPGAASPPEGGSDLSAASPLTSPEGRTEGAPALGRALSADGVKGEKVEPSDDEDVSLDATIGYVADYEAAAAAPGGRSGGGGGGGYGDGSDPLSSLAGVQDERLARDTAAAAAAVMALAAGPSQQLQPFCHNSPGKKKYSCDICGKQYNYRDSVYRHKRTHEGKTGCFVCGKVLSCLPTLREHMRFQHGMTPDEVACLVTARAGLSSPMALPPASAAGGGAPLPPARVNSVPSLSSGGSSLSTASSRSQPQPLPPSNSAAAVGGGGTPLPPSARMNNVPAVGGGAGSSLHTAPSRPQPQSLPQPPSNSAAAAVAGGLRPAVPGSVPPPRPSE